MSPKGQKGVGKGQGASPAKGGKTGGSGMGGGRGLGQGGECVCPGCGERQPHERGKPCYGVKCPKCGRLMTRA